MKRQFLCSLMALVALSVFAFPRSPLAASYYENKVIKMIVGLEPGGGYDRISRLLAKHLPKYIPGKPTILVENMPGGNSMIAANQLYNLAKPDGLTIGTFNRGLPFAQLLKAEGVKFLTIRTDLPYKTFDELRKAKEPIHLACQGPGTTDYQFPTLLKEFLGLNVKLVIYPSSAAGMLAVERKEADGRAGAYSSLLPFIDRGLVRPLIRGRIWEPGIENLPVDVELTTDKMGKTLLTMFSATPDLVGRPYVAPPKTPPEMMSMLRDAFAKAGKDPEVQEEAKKLKMTVNYVPAEECMKALNEILNQPEEIVKEFAKYIKF
jgi:tripartite-type tricarboxylate transporter receptor subunit TctC